MFDVSSLVAVLLQTMIYVYLSVDHMMVNWAVMVIIDYLCLALLVISLNRKLCENFLAVIHQLDSVHYDFDRWPLFG